MRHFCFFSYEIFPFTRGGAGTYITSVAVRLIALGNKVTLVLDIDDETFCRCVENSRNQATESSRLEFVQLSSIVSPGSVPRENFPSDAHWKSYQFSLAAESIHAQAPIDILEFVDYCGPSYYTLLKRATAPQSLPKNIVVRMHNTIELIDKCASSNFSRSRIFDYWLERTTIALVDRILSPGNRYWSDVAARIYNVSAERIITSPPCRSRLPRIADGISGKNIVFVGRISTIKGMDLFLQAMAAICTDTMLASRFNQIRVIGPGESVSTQDEKAILNYKRGIPQEKIQFLGNLAESDLIHELAEAQFAVFPNRCESFCYAAHEAHMIGVPLILSSIPAFLDHFVDGESALFFNGTAHDLTSLIRKLLVDSDLRNRLSYSVQQHRARYDVVTYGTDIDDEASASNRPSSVDVVAQQPADLFDNSTAVTVIFFSRNSDRENTYNHIKGLFSTVCNVDVIVLVESESEGTIHAFGQHWDLADPKRSSIEPLRVGLVLLLSDSFTLTPSFVERGKDMMARMSAVGAILPIASNGRWGSAEYGPAADLFILRAGEQPQGFPLLMRLDNQTPLQQLLHDSSPYTALTLLIELRAAGFTIVDDIYPTLTHQTDKQGFALPERRDFSAFVKQNISRFRDYELASNLVDVVQTSPAIAITGQGTPGTTQRVMQDLYHGINDVLYLHVVDGVVAVMSIVDPAVGQELNWRDMQPFGSHQVTEVKDRPFGILELKEGSCLRIAGGVRLVFNLGLNPTGGRLAMIANNRCALLSTQHETFNQRFFTPKELFEIVATSRFELPDRAYHLSAYRRAPGSNRKPIAIDPSPIPNADSCFFFENPRDKIALPTAYAYHHAVQLQKSGKSEAILADEIATYAHSLGVKIASFLGLEWVEIATRLLEDFNNLRVEFIVGPSAIWAPTMALQLLKIGNLVERFRDRVGIIHPPSLVGYFPAFRTVRTYSWPPPSRTVSNRSVNTETTVQIIIDRNPANEFYMGHMAAVAKILQTNSVLIDEISVPCGQSAQDRLFESFGLSHLLRYYEEIDAHTALPGRQIVYLNPFPFGENIDNLRNALRLGWHTVISPYENSLFEHIDSEKFHVVTYWEDIEVISQILIKSICVM